MKVEQASQKITQLAKEFVKNLKIIGEECPDIGIGDTTPDEDIVDYVYGLLHYDNDCDYEVNFT